MHKAGSAYICAWRMNDRKQYTLKVYKIGEANDAQKLRRKRTNAERSAKYRAKLKLRKEYERQIRSSTLPQTGLR